MYAVPKPQLLRVALYRILSLVPDRMSVSTVVVNLGLTEILLCLMVAQPCCMVRPTPVYKLALKAQSQCRAALATISFIENPQTVSFIKQQNIGYQHQINNDPPLNNLNSQSELEGISRRTSS
jgi:hypothetical protein